MSASDDLLAEFVTRYPAQPATAFFRAIEISELASSMRDAEGLGLDLGCGDGILTDILFKRIGKRPHLVGVDPDPLETDAAKAYDFYERIHTCGGAEIPEPDGKFDYVFSNSVLEHIPDLVSVIAEVSRVLRPGGKFYFTVPCPGFHANLMGSVLGRSRPTYLAEMDKRLAHLHYLSELDWNQICCRNGLTLDTVTGYVGRAQTRRWETLSRLTGGLLYKLVGQTARPIEIQRALQLRAFQNQQRLPSFLAAGLAKAIRLGLAEEKEKGEQSCLLVVGHR